MRKILYISHADKYSGAELVLLNLLRDNSSWDSAVFLPAGKFQNLLEKNKIRSFRSKYLSVLNRKTSFLWPLLFIFQVILVTFEINAVIKRWKPDIIQANHLSSLPYCILPSLLSSKKLFWHMHDIKSYKTLDGKACRFLSRFVCRIISISNVVTNGLVDCHVPVKKITTCWNGIDPEKFPRNFEDPDNRYFQKNENQWNIVVIGTVEPNKGQHVFIEAIKILKLRLSVDQNISCFIVGDSFLGSSTYTEKIKQFVLQNNLSGIIKFCGRLDAMRTVYENSDIVVIPSVFDEPFGMVVIESMAMGCITVASNSGEIPNIIEDNISGVLFEKNNSEDLAGKLYSFINGDIDKILMQRRAKDRVIKEFSLEKQIKSIKHEYDQVLSRI